MEQYLVNTNKKSCTVNFQISTDGSTVPIYIVGYDIFNANTLFFRSRFKVTGSEEINLGCPQSPGTLKVIVWSEDDMPYTLSSVTTSPLNGVQSDDPAVRFIEKFSRICGRLRPGNYISDNVPFLIQFKRNIYTDSGDIHPTPARIHEELPLIQVSENKFDESSIPERIIFLLHEYCHNFKNWDPDNEKEADQNALDIYRDLGYPKIEAVNAFGDIMSDTDDNYQRMLNLYNM